MCKICSKLTIKTPERRHWSCSVVSIVYLEHNANIVLVFPNHSHPWGQCSQYVETIINCSKSTMKTPERRYFLLFTLNIIFYTVLGQSRPNPNPNSNFNPNQGSIFLGGNCPDTISHRCLIFLLLTLSKLMLAWESVDLQQFAYFFVRSQKVIKLLTKWIQSFPLDKYLFKVNHRNLDQSLMVI